MRAKVHECVLAAVDGRGPTWWTVEELYSLPSTCADEKVKIGNDDVYVVKTSKGEV